MTKITASAIFFLLLFSRFLGDGVSLEMEVPDTVQAGTEFPVFITLNKSNIEGFARFSQDLPYGLSAAAEPGLPGEFLYEDNKVKVIWLSLPPEEKIQLKYKISVVEYVKGSFTLEGKFAYIENNERKILEIPPRKIYIRPSPGVDPSKITDIQEYGQLIARQEIPAQQTPAKAEPEKEPTLSASSSVSRVENVYHGNAMCLRQHPEKGSDNGISGYRVNLLIHKGTMDKYAKIEEYIPEGYTAMALETQTGLFTFEDGVAKFMYLKLPEKSDFIISYLLVPVNAPTGKEPVIDGAISYVIKDKTYTSKIIECSEDLASLDREGINRLLATVNKKTVPAEITRTPSVLTTQKGKTGSGSSYAARTYSAEKKKYPYLRRHLESYESYLLEPEEGVYFRIQIAAGHTPINVKTYFRKMHITENIRIEKHEGWYKYSVGSFKDYKSARDYRVKIWNNTLAKDAFITAYHNGKRITVQEALMITNQPWVK